jgi:hypothetical protein
MNWWNTELEASSSQLDTWLSIVCVKVEILHNQLDLQVFTEMIFIFKPIDYLCQFLSLPLLIPSIDFLHNIVVVLRNFCEEGLKREAV